MPGKSAVGFDGERFGRLKRMAKNKSESSRNLEKSPAFACDVPREIGVQLTYRCNLRCAHCFQWNEDGHFRRLEKEKRSLELSPDAIEKLFRATRETKAGLYAWGGEPLMYSEWGRLSRLIESDPRWTVLCTNGLLVEENLESLLRISSRLALLLSIDGLEEDNDAVRGRGSFGKIMKNMELLRELRKRKEFRGIISVNCVLTDRTAGKMPELADYFESLGIDTLFLSFPWYISRETGEAMDAYCRDRLAWLDPVREPGTGSWHCYTHRIDGTKIPVLAEGMKKISSASRKIRIRFQPALRADELAPFVLGAGAPAQGRTGCLSLSYRLDVLADGTIPACKAFPETVMGNIYSGEVLDVWKSGRFNRFRETIRQELMPVCAKCVLLYRDGI
ncbi:MAG: radical SAM protein [Spirochaetales bacterium]|nr:radical SAM protein [Spirochaetales bacterium]